LPLHFFVIRSVDNVFTAHATFSGAAIVIQSMPVLIAAKPASANAPNVIPYDPYVLENLIHNP